MPTLKQLHGKINTTKATVRVTKVLQMISASKFKKSQLAMAFAKDFWLTAKDAMKIAISLRERLQESVKLPLFNLLTSKKSSEKSNDSLLYILFTSDRGLCGSLNSALIKFMTQILYQDIKLGKSVTIFCLGKKGMNFLQHNKDKLSGVKVIKITDVSHDGLLEVSKFKKLVDQVETLYLQNNFDNIGIFYNEFESISIQKPKIKWVNDMLYNKSMSDDDNIDHQTGFYMTDIDLCVIIDNAARFFFNASLWLLFKNSISCEHIMRMKTMNNATQNGNESIKHLLIKYNKIRQTAITGELIDILSGAEAQACHN